MAGKQTESPKRITKKQRNRGQQAPRGGGMAAPWWRSTGPIAGAAAAVVVAIVLGFVVLGSRSSTPPSAGQGYGAVPASVLAAIDSPAPSVIATVGAGGQPGNLSRVSGGSPLVDSTGKPLVVYVGAEYCPFCAAERWSLAIAVARFGTFSSLQEMQSSSTDVYPNTDTFSFHGSSYTSSTIDFSPNEIEDREQQPFESPSAQVSQIFSTIDQPPYTASQGGFPFIDIGGRFVLSQTSYNPQILQGLTWDQIASDLSDPTSPVTQAIIGNANYLTAAICTTTNQQPASACAAPAITSIETKLNAQPAVG